MPRTSKAPGLVWRSRGDGTRAAYWAARQDLIKQGYQPRMVRLHYAEGDPMLIGRCHALQAEMLEWAKTAGVGRPPQYDGTVRSLVAMFEAHPDSSYRDIEPDTREKYSRALKLYIVGHKGAKRIDTTTGNDVKRWAKELLAAKYSPNTVYYAINVFKIAVSFGSSLRIRECTVLRQELRDTRFHGGRRRTEQLTYGQVAAFRDKAREMGLHYMARCITLQFDFAMRRRDVIGKYYREDDSDAGIRKRARKGRWVWRDGLTWADKDEDGIVRRVVSKTRRTTAAVAVHAIADYPDVEAELARTPIERRVGPLVLHDKTGVPPTEEQCRRDFRTIAAACGIPFDVKMMDARAGADTEAYEAGVSTEDAMALLTHSEEATNRGYLRELTEQSRRAAKMRVASRKK